MKLLIGGSKSKLFHLKEFGNSLEKHGVNYKLVEDVKFCDGFPSRNVENWFQSNKKFNSLIDDFKPDAIFVDRTRHFGKAAVETKLPLFVLMRGHYWEETKWAKETLYKYPPKSFAIDQWDKMAKKCFEGATSILGITKFLEGVIKKHYPNKLLFSGGVNAKSRSSIFFASGFDIICTSESEITLQQIAKILQKGSRDFTSVGKIYLKNKLGKIIDNSHFGNIIQDYK